MSDSNVLQDQDPSPQPERSPASTNIQPAANHRSQTEGDTLVPIDQAEDKKKYDAGLGAAFDEGDSHKEITEKQKKMKELGITTIKELVTEDVTVRQFLIELRSLRVLGCLLTPKIIFVLTLVAFFLPSLWGVSSVLIDQDLPSRVFYDTCRNGTGEVGAIFNGEVTVEFPYKTCVECAGQQPYVFTNSSSVSRDSQNGFIGAVIGINVVVTFIATTFYVRLAIKEFVACHLLSYDILVEAPLTCRSILMLVVIVLLCIAAAGVNVAYGAFLRLRLDNLPLGYNNGTDYICFTQPDNVTGNLYAVFAPDNASAKVALSIDDPIAIIAAILAAFLLYVPLLVRLATLVFSHFNTLAVKDLMSNSRITAKIFKELTYSVHYDDLMEAIGSYAETQDPEDCSCTTIVTRIFALNFSCADPEAIFFSFSWGKDDSDVNFVVNLLEKRGKLLPYTEEQFAIEFSNLRELHAKDNVLVDQKNKDIVEIGPDGEEKNPLKGSSTEKNEKEGDDEDQKNKGE